MDLEKKLLGALCIVLLSGCHALEQKRYEKIGPPRTSPPLIKDSEIESMADAVVKIKKQRGTELPPMPPTPKAHVRSLAVPEVPDKFVVLRWDPVNDAAINYRVTWAFKAFPGWPLGVVTTAQSKVDVVGLFKEHQVPSGWYRIDVRAVNDSYLESDALSVPFFWCPVQ